MQKDQRHEGRLRHGVGDMFSKPSSIALSSLDSTLASQEYIKFFRRVQTNMLTNLFPHGLMLIARTAKEEIVDIHCQQHPFGSQPERRRMVAHGRSTAFRECRL